MLAKRIRERFHGKPKEYLEEFLIRHYPLGGLEFKEPGWKLFFDTGLATAKPIGWGTSTHLMVCDSLVIETGMYVDEHGNAMIYDQELKVG